MNSDKAIILIIDDNITNLHVLIDYLNGAGYQTLIAQNGEGALRQLNYALPDIILLDIIMPGIDGFETCRRLKQEERTKNIPVIFMSALSEIVDKVKGFSVGAVDYITKPFHQDEVLARIAAHLTIQQQKKALEKLNISLAESNATKDKFFSIIAHDMKNTFNALIPGTTVLENSVNDLSPDETKMIAHEINNAARIAYSLMENLLKWARLQQDVIDFEPESIDLNAIISENINNLRQSAEKKHIRLSSSILPDTFVYADVNMINTVFRNLISNAIKFTYENGEIKISAMPLNQVVEISVSDTGMGINEENVKNLLKIDSKFKMVGTSGEKGTGLGLILCKEFVEKNNGKIWVESEIGKGSTFRFTLPGFK